MTIIIYTDGACSANGTSAAFGGMGVHFPGREYPDISEKYVPTSSSSIPTNNICELLAIKLALERTDFDTDKIIYSDSAYCVNIFNTWLKSWKVQGILQSKANWELILEIDDLLAKNSGSVTLIHVGRSSHPGNVIADRLAVAGKMS
jgi:ribonuclease HI